MLSPFSKRDYDRYGIELLKSDFNVFVFDLTALFRPDFFKKKYNSTYYFEGYHSIESRKTFLSLLKRSTVNIAIDFLDISRNSYFIRNKIKSRGGLIVKVLSGQQPKPPMQKKLKKVKNYLSKISRLSEIGFVVHKLLVPRKHFYSDFIMTGGLSGLNEIAVKYSKEVIPSHSFDYDLFLKIDNSLKSEREEKYVVYIDQYYAKHPDLEFMGEESFIDENNFYPLLESFFLDFERVTRLKVIVAAHPRSQYELYPDLFGHRKLVRGKTAELIKESEMVLLHTSTAISFAVLWEKPLLFLTSNEIINSFVHLDVLSFSHFFSKRALNMDNYTVQEINNKLQKSYSKDNYQKYQDNYLKYPGSPNVNNWQIFADFFSHKFNNTD